MRNPRPLWVALTGLLLVAAPVTSQVYGSSTDGDPKQVTLVARESGCPDGKTFCFEVEERPSSLSPGDEVNLTFQNPSHNRGSHNVHVTTNDSADPAHQDTAASEAIANTSTIDPGETARTNFTVPDAEGLYLWCDETGHEASGMWTSFSIGENGTADNQTTSNDTQDNDTQDNDTRENETQDNETEENRSYNDTDDNQTKRNDTSQNASDENETDGNGTEDNQTTRDDTSSRDEPLEPTEGSGQDDDGDANRETPVGVAPLIAAIAIATLVVQVARRRS